MRRLGDVRLGRGSAHEIIPDALAEILRELGKLGIDVLFELLSGLRELFLKLDPAFDLFWVFDQRQVIRPLRAREHTIEAVVVFHRDCVIFVVVTARAGDG